MALSDRAMVEKQELEPLGRPVVTPGVPGHAVVNMIAAGSSSSNYVHRAGRYRKAIRLIHQETSLALNSAGNSGSGVSSRY